MPVDALTRISNTSPEAAINRVSMEAWLDARTENLLSRPASDELRRLFQDLGLGSDALPDYNSIEPSPVPHNWAGHFAKPVAGYSYQCGDTNMGCQIATADWDCGVFTQSPCVSVDNCTNGCATTECTSGCTQSINVGCPV